MNIFLVLLAYLVGSIPFGLLIGKFAGVDVRTAGSGNIGATNVGRLLGRGYGLLTLACDVGKALLPMMVAGRLVTDPAMRELTVLLCAAAAFLGHMFPVYLRFRGGKGVATALGIFLYLAPVAALADLVIFAAVVYNWGYVSLGSLTAALMMPGLVWLVNRSVAQAVLALGIGILIWVKHHENIRRLMHGEEKSWRKKNDS